MKSTRQLLKKIPNFSYFYRHEETGIYYGIKRNNNKIQTHSLKTDDRKLAERRLKEWIENLENPKPENIPTFEEMFEKFIQIKKGNAEGTLENYKWALGTFRKYGGKALLDTPIDQIKPSKFAAFFSQFEKEWQPYSFNNLTLIVKQVFDVAFMDGIIPSNPYHLIPNKRQKVIRKPDTVPTIEQCVKIVESIRNQPFADTRDKSGDLCEFLHLAALGEAEARNLKWSDVDFEQNFLRIRRQKTGVYFQVPLYPWLREFMIQLHQRQDEPKGEIAVFKIKTAKQALYNACKRLKLPAFSPRDLRKARIVFMLRKGVAVEQIAKWQAHRDNGVLIRKTYSWVLDEDAKRYEQEQLAKLN